MNNRSAIAPSESSITDPYKKGYLFEEFITKLFNERHFKLETWRKAERKEYGVYPFFMAHPDLELVFVGKRKYRFAVECKWRSEFKRGKITWVDSYNKILIYRDFQSRFRIPVFIAIGIGGKPSAPGKLFLTPLDDIGNVTEVYESELLPYSRQPNHRFFYDTIQLKLF
ncbi:MAG TPA: hypothetical protein PLL71_02755 [Agriterribacter sp.]|nr:hypothetical protein [Agriterribacter sp.]HRQ48929.1 hypothetical protein [Agriterribacter sp.]